ncbi:MAG: hypothetical protein Q9160_005830 [Pyrenula sp. 1 TL-2023]
MSGIALKLFSLTARTLAKPLANGIKQRARDHETFRKFCVNWAQRVHRYDMTLRLGLLRDTETIRAQEARAAEEARADRHKHTVQGPKTEEQTKADEDAGHDTKKREEVRKKKREPKIRPLSEAKAIETGANFFSEMFIYMVGVGLIGFEFFRSKSKESNRREDVTDRIVELEESEKAARRALVDLERELLKLRSEKQPGKVQHRILQSKVWELEEKEEREEEEKSRGWLTRVMNYVNFGQASQGSTNQDSTPAQETATKPAKPSKSPLNEPESPKEATSHP